MWIIVFDYKIAFVRIKRYRRLRAMKPDISGLLTTQASIVMAILLQALLDRPRRAELDAIILRQLNFLAYALCLSCFCSSLTYAKCFSKFHLAVHQRDGRGYLNSIRFGFILWLSIASFL
jgi:hypothetical protein